MNIVRSCHPLRALTSLVPVFAAILLVSCVSCCGTSTSSPHRSVAAFCSTYKAEKASFQAKYASTEQPLAPNASFSQVLGVLIRSVQSLGDGTVILTKLDAVAPESIEPDMAEVLASWKDMQGTLGDELKHSFDPQGLFGDVAAGLFEAVEANGSWTRVGTYINTNCT